MTELLQQAIAAIERLPADVQDAIAARLLAEAADEQSWAARVEGTNEDQWDRLAAHARRAIAAGEVLPLDELFSSRRPV